MIYLYEMIDTRHRSYIFIFSQYYIVSPHKIIHFFHLLTEKSIVNVKHNRLQNKKQK